jgi:hypothetical protein
MPAFHMVELLDASIRNVPLAGMAPKQQREQA